MEMNSMIFYIVLVLGFSAVALYLTIRALRRAEKRRIRFIRKTDLQEPIETESPEQQSEEIAEDRGIESIEGRFGGLRKLLIPAIVLLSIFLAALPFMNLPGIYLTLLAGTLTVIIGIASKPFVENLIAGIVISWAQPIRIGDTVTIKEHYGTVEKIDLIYTTLKIWNWRRFVIPNNVLLQMDFENHSLFDSNEWVKVEFYVEPRSDIELVEKLAIAAMQESNFLIKVESPSFWVMSMDKEAIRCWVAGWADSPPNAWALADETRKRLIPKLIDHGIGMHCFSTNSTAAGGSLSPSLSLTENNHL